MKGKIMSTTTNFNFQDLVDNAITTSDDDRAFLLGRLNRPKPRIELGLLLPAVATAGIDISDGLLADLDHLLKESGALGAVIDVSFLPLSPQAVGTCGEAVARQIALNGGDDYEICFTASPTLRSQIEQLSDSCDVKLTCIGSVRAFPGIVFAGADNLDLTEIKSGYRHDWS